MNEYNDLVPSIVFLLQASLILSFLPPFRWNYLITIGMGAIGMLYFVAAFSLVSEFQGNAIFITPSDSSSFKTPKIVSKVVKAAPIGVPCTAVGWKGPDATVLLA